jgi:hypothetical protein
MQILSARSGRGILGGALVILASGFMAAACGDSGGSGSSGSGSSAVCADVSCDGVKKFGELPWDQCTDCHSSDSAVRQAEGVPDDSDYTTYDGAASRAELVAERVADGTMPPSTTLPDADKQAFIAWGCCDAPQ